MILAGDIGGTKTNLALVRVSGRRASVRAQQRFSTSAYPHLAAMVRDFLRGRAYPEAACFGVAGPVVNGRCSGTNLPWDIDEAALRRALRLPAVRLINDLVATAYGIDWLPPRAFTVLNRGRPQPGGTIAVIAAGTGLGEAVLAWDGCQYRALASEGGHADFAPRTPREWALHQRLAKRYGHVSCERVLSGPGKIAIYEFLKAARGAREPAWLRQRFARADTSAVISEEALSGRSSLCREAVELFISIYGAEAGNLALKTLATGGVYLGGGIAPTLGPLLARGRFMRAFTDKGRLAPLLRQIPVRVILDDKAALLGAARCGALTRRL